MAGNKVVSLPSTAYATWHKDALWQLKKIKPYTEEYPVAVTISLYPKTKRRRDLDNVASSILDTLVDAGIIADDDLTHVERLAIMFMEYDKENPRAEIWIG